MDEMIKSGMEVNVQAKTALLKGYAHSGMLRKGSQLHVSLYADFVLYIKTFEIVPMSEH